MSWLKKVGSVALQVGKVLPTVGPIVTAVIPGTKDDQIVAAATTTVDQLVNIIVSIEKAGQAINAAGAQKAAMAAPLIAQAILQSTALAGKQIGDEPAFLAACGKIGADLADALNALKADG